MYRIQAIAYILPFDRYSVLKFIKRSKCVRIFNEKLKHKKETKKKKNNEIKRKKIIFLMKCYFCIIMCQNIEIVVAVSFILYTKINENFLKKKRRRLYDPRQNILTMKYLICVLKF